MLKNAERSIYHSDTYLFHKKSVPKYLFPYPCATCLALVTGDLKDWRYVFVHVQVIKKTATIYISDELCLYEDK